MRTKLTLLAAALAVAGTGLLAAPAHASGNCNGQIDYTCYDSNGDFCTFYLARTNCVIGVL
jgi:hypothetical protein